MKKQLRYYYDKEADVFYFSSGAPNIADTTVEAGDDVLLRINQRTKRVRGFTLINASQHLSLRKTPYALPLSLTHIV